ncbi:solute carrier family 2, facilitated glucose transporter member 5 [Anolis carolinensis]|uniref:solute carrier family 2, facilitated glucose transporter member 5 n=1 Tax=Anolis carolinensis TaxID=28377 RepID=UPI002F2B76F7
MEKRLDLPSSSRQIRKADLTKRLIWITVVSCLLSMHFGYNFWVSYSITVLQDNPYNITIDGFSYQSEAMVAIAIGVFPFGGIFGATVSACLTDRIGRKGTLLLANFLSLISALFMASSHLIGPFEYIIFARMYTGMCAGMASTSVPLYLGEISPRSRRGGVVMMPHFFLILGVLLAQILALKHLLGTPKGWPTLMGLAGVMPLSQSVLLPFFPESPRYILIQKKNERKAREALQMLRGKDDVDDEIQELCQEDIAEKADKRMSMLKLIKKRNMRWHLITVVVVMTAQQLSGTNAVYFYSERIFKSTVLKDEAIAYVSIATTAVTSCSTFLGIYLVDSLGRRVLLLMGYLACAIFLVLTVMSMELQKSMEWMSYITGGLISAFLLSHAFGPYPIPYLIVTELFLQSSRSSAYMIAGILEWLLNFITAVSYIHVARVLGAFSILFYFPVCVCCFVYIFNVFPETKNRTFVDIKRLMAIQTSKKVKVKQAASK